MIQLRAFDFRHVVMQPTSVCNLNCTYCYLPDRQLKRRMPVAIASAVADSLSLAPHPIRVLWHGGEPLATGSAYMRQLLGPFGNLFEAGRVRFGVQTNGTLIDQSWCRVFGDFQFDVGVSLDGTAADNAARRTWSGRPAFAATMQGIERLRDAGIPFGVIAVVSTANVGDPEGLYAFFQGLGCSSLNINIEEREGLNQSAPGLPDEKVAEFWTRLFSAWRLSPTLRIREFDRALAWLDAGPGAMLSGPRDLWPTVACDGDVVVLAPELMGARTEVRETFVVGNVAKTPLPEIVRQAGGADHVRDFWSGVSDCRAQCAYFSYCGGGHASNKFFELGSTRGTETAYCRHSYQVVADVLLDHLRANN